MKRFLTTPFGAAGLIYTMVATIGLGVFVVLAAWLAGGTSTGSTTEAAPTPLRPGVSAGLPQIEVSDSLRALGVTFGIWKADRSSFRGTVTPTMGTLQRTSSRVDHEIDVKVYDHAGLLRSGCWVHHAREIQVGETGDIKISLLSCKPAEVGKILLTTK